MKHTETMQGNSPFETYAVINANIVGTRMSEALGVLVDRVENGIGGYACFVNAHVSVMTRRDRKVESAINSATFAFPDGMPVYLVGRYLRGLPIEKISGPDFMQRIFESERARKLNHYFYGGQEEALAALIKKLNGKYPFCNIVGAESPPFRPLSDQEKSEAINRINSANPHFVWVGLGAPKQELWMKENTNKLSRAMLLGVGAAFDFHAETIVRAPVWAQRCGLEWFHRLIQEPRLFRRYFETNILFVLFTTWDSLKHLVTNKNNNR